MSNHSEDSSSSLSPPSPPSSLSSFDRPSPPSLPYVIGGLSCFFLGIALGFRKSSRQAQAMSMKYKDAPNGGGPSPSSPPLPPITPEARRLAIRRTMSALGYGTLVCVAGTAMLTMGAMKAWNINSVEQFHDHFRSVTVTRVSSLEAALPRRLIEESKGAFKETQLGRWMKEKSDGIESKWQLSREDERAIEESMERGAREGSAEPIEDAFSKTNMDNKIEKK